MLTYPSIDPVALSLGPVHIRWYGIMYLTGFALAFLLGLYRANRLDDWDMEMVSDLIVYAALGVVIGGRLGFFLFYNWQGLMDDPLSLFKVWQGGMAFHGGVLGVLVSVWWFCRKTGKKIFEVADFLVPLVPLGLGAGRLGNFINGELWGRVTDVSWGMVFAHVDMSPRHPSQLYEFFLEGVVLFTVLWVYSSKPRPRMAVTGLFLAGYGVLRFLVEFVREMDPSTDPVAWDWLTMGQLLSVPMVLVGVLMMVVAYRRAMLANSQAV